MRSMSMVIAIALLACGRVNCGRVRRSAPRPPAEHIHRGPFIAVSAAWNHTCALRPDRTAFCWGGDELAEGVGDFRPTPPLRFAAIATSRRMNCGIRAKDYAIQCWGDCTWGDCSPPRGRFSTLALAEGGGCGIDSEGRARCWGLPSQDRLAVPDAVNESRLTRVAFGNGVAGAITAEGRLHVWAGLQNQYTTPILDGGRALAGRRFREVAFDHASACAIEVNGDLHCWRNAVGDPLHAGPGPFEQLAMSIGEGACVRSRSGEAYCRGTPGRRRPDGLFASITVGQNHVCGILANSGDIRCWGRNWAGQLDGRSPNRWMP